MKKLLPYSNEEIAIRVGKLKSVNVRVAAEEHRQRKAALDAPVAERVEAAGFDKAMLADESVAEVVRQGLAGGFKHEPAKEDLDKIAAIKAEAPLPNMMKGEGFKTGDCDCHVHRVYYRCCREHPDGECPDHPG